MGKIWVKEFTGGLDTRRMPVSTSGAVLMTAVNGHITRGGEFEKREAFVKLYDLPAGRTFGLAATGDGLYVFGHQAAPGGLSPDITYQRLQHPITPSTALTRILNWDLYAGLLYVVAGFADGSRYMFYDGEYVNSWSDGFARGSFTVDADDITPGKRAKASFHIDPGNSPSGSEVTSITVADVDLITAPVPWGAIHDHPNSYYVQQLVDAINSNTGTTGFSATRKSWTVNISAPVGDDFNGEPMDIVSTATLVISEQTKFSGGAEPIVPTLTDLWVGGQKIINVDVEWTTNAIEMADDITAAIVAYSGTSGYTATSGVGSRKVTVRATTAGEDPNGARIKYTGDNGLSLSDLTNMQGGTVTALPRGIFNKTIGQKEYAVAGSVLYFSGIAAPTEWTTDAVGAGFIDMATEISGAERLQAVVKYQNYIAVFAEETVVIEYIDPDPALNRQVQVLAKTGTFAPHSVTQFGDRDIYYLDQTGLRSLQARDASNSAATTDIGVMVDSLILAKLRTMSTFDKSNIMGVIEPQEGRYWLIIQGQVYVFSYFQGSKVSAWSTYSTTYFDGAGAQQSFTTDAVTTYNKRLYLRAGEKIFAYGGDVTEEIYDATIARARLPYLDANDPTRKKIWKGVDAAVEDEWQIKIALDPNNEGTAEPVANITQTTYDVDQLPTIGESTHISVLFQSSGDGKAVLSSCVIHYEGDQIEDK